MLLQVAKECENEQPFPPVPEKPLMRVTLDTFMIMNVSPAET